jgi:hypothetical protein
LTSEKEEEKECTDKLEKGIIVVYDCIPYSAQAPDRSAQENIKIISQTIERYRQEIEEIK